jgi:S-adenosylmethionine decarboxylase
MRIHGQELWADVAVDTAALADHDRVLAGLHAGAAAMGATVLSDHRQAFEPSGLTAIVVIGESHLLASTYEELGIVAINIQTCSESMDLLAGLEAICTALDARGVRSLVGMRRLDAPMRVVLQAADVEFRDGRLQLDEASQPAWGFSATAAIR